jgi:signal transduction histidine kinase/CheY-like chemotaxis protein
MTQSEIIKILGLENSDLTKIIDSTPSCLKIITKDGHLLKMNPVGLKLIESPDFKTVMSANVYDLVIEEHRDLFIAFNERICSGKQESLIFNLIGLNGTERIMETFAGPYKLTNGEIAHLAITNDITQRINAEKELKIRKDLIEASSRLAKDDFLANMSHEIRTPMNAILGFTELIDTTDTSEEQQEYLDLIKTASRNLLTIVNDILDFSKIESGEITFNEIPFCINDTLSKTKKMMSTLASDKGLKLQFYTDTDIKHEILGDEVRLNQVLINLISNAIKFTEKGKIEVFTSLLNETDSSYNLEFSIKDTGIGIPEDKLIDIFDRFKQAEKYTTRKYGGTGLGLSISKKIIAALNGILEAESTLGKGSKFSFSIQFPKSKTQYIKEKVNISRAETKISGSTILLIEDNQLNQLLVKKILIPEGVNLTIASDGKEGVDLISNATVKFDVILMDLQMPIMNGYEATIHIRKKLKSNVPIIAMTAHSLIGEKKKCLDLSMDEYISKPHTKEELITKISKYITPQKKVKVV